MDSILKPIEESGVLSSESFEKPLMPIALIILDINMPMIDGLEAAQLVKERFDELNQRLIEKNNLLASSTHSRLVVRPMLVHLT